MLSLALASALRELIIPLKPCRHFCRHLSLSTLVSIIALMGLHHLLKLTIELSLKFGQTHNWLQQAATTALTALTRLEAAELWPLAVDMDAIFAKLTALETVRLHFRGQQNKGRCAQASAFPTSLIR